MKLKFIFTRVVFLSVLSFLLSLSACDTDIGPKEELDIVFRSFDKKIGTRFTPLPKDLFAIPKLTEIVFEHAGNADAIWGATGSDDQGNIYFGASTHGVENQTAYLYQYEPEKGGITRQGDVLEQLKTNGVFSKGMGQNKLHSKFYQANDGYVYFSSFDEGGEREGVNPTWGGHLWRKKPSASQWEHVFSSEEALIAINTNGRFVYALGYWDHVLYQYDTQTNRKKRVVVGSLNQHVSRNFLVDEFGHAYVPKVIKNNFNEVEVYLNEYDVTLNLIGSYPMDSYRQQDMNEHHGIVGHTSLENGNIIFTTSEGGMYQINTHSQGDEKLSYKGTMHPNGQAYIPSLFSFSGESYVAGVGRSIKGYEWIVFDLDSGMAVNQPLNTDGLKGLLLYGSLTKDSEGHFYLGGWVSKENNVRGYKGYRPIFIKLSID